MAGEADLLIDVGHKLESAGGGGCCQLIAGHGQLGQLLLLLQVRELRQAQRYQAVQRLLIWPGDRCLSYTT